MKKEFNLSDKRMELNSIVWDKKTFPVDILREVEKQDKEFIKKLKYRFFDKNSIEIIDKLVGADLIELKGGKKI